MIGFGLRLGLTRRGDAGGFYNVNGIEPTLVVDFGRGVFGDRPLEVQDYLVSGASPALVVDFANEVFGD